MELQGVLPPIRGWSAYWSYVRANLSYVTPTARSETHDEYLLGVSHRMFSRLRLGGVVNGYRHDAGDTTFGYRGTRLSMFVVVGATTLMRQLDLPVPRF